MTTGSIKIVTFTEFEPQHIAQVEAIDPRVKLTNSRYGMMPDGTLGQTRSDDEMKQLLADVEIVYGSRMPAWIPADTPKLKWIQMGHAGMEMMTRLPLWQSDVILTNATGIQAPMIAEWAISMIFYFAKQMPDLLSKQRRHEWGKFSPRYTPVMGSTLGLIGLGHIGGEIAKRAKGLGMRVIGIRRSARNRRIDSDGVDELYQRDDLLEMLSMCDYVVTAVPFTPETRGMIDAEGFKAMKKGAYFINVCRGGVVDEPAMIAALQTGHLAGAGLDVFSVEPLPTDSPLWDMPNVVISPHQSGGIPGGLQIGVDLFCENLRRYLAGKTMLNVLSRERGY